MCIYNREASQFTSHYVSINSLSGDAYTTLCGEFTSHYVSINSTLSRVPPAVLYHLHPTMYLLIRGRGQRTKEPRAQFTSHYVSINSTHDKKLIVKGEKIYIPLCIY